MSRSSAIWHPDDDWSGMTSPAHRRICQNRLNQRAYRKRKLYKRLLPQDSSEIENGGVINDLACRVLLKSTEERHRIADFLHEALNRWKLGILNSGDLPMLTRVNALEALFKNAQALDIPWTRLVRPDFESPFSLGVATLEIEGGLPAHLRPTPLQKAVVHQIWVDLFPFPEMRDNILRCIQAGKIEQGSLCQQLVIQDMVDLSEESAASVLIWGAPWEAESWEFSARFLSKWGFLLHECPGILLATNHWRETRGETRIDFIMNRE